MRRPPRRDRRVETVFWTGRWPKTRVKKPQPGWPCRIGAEDRWRVPAAAGGLRSPTQPLHHPRGSGPAVFPADEGMPRSKGRSLYEFTTSRPTSALWCRYRQDLARASRASPWTLNVSNTRRLDPAPRLDRRPVEDALPVDDADERRRARRRKADSVQGRTERFAASWRSSKQSPVSVVPGVPGVEVRDVQRHGQSPSTRAPDPAGTTPQELRSGELRRELVQDRPLLPRHPFDLQEIPAGRNRVVVKRLPSGSKTAGKPWYPPPVFGTMPDTATRAAAFSPSVLRPFVRPEDRLRTRRSRRGGRRMRGADPWRRPLRRSRGRAPNLRDDRGALDERRNSSSAFARSSSRPSRPRTPPER